MACQCIPNEKCAKFVELVVETCAYAGSGNVLKVQQMLHLCAEHKEDKESIYQVAAVIGVALIAFGEEIGTEMAMRTMQHLLQYGEPTIKRTVPLAIGLLRISHPEVATMDLLNKLAYDTDPDTSMSAIFALGLIGAGTNNSKLAGNLRFLASYYSVGQQSENQLFIVRIAQGLVHMGKGLLGLNPMHSDKFLFSNVSLAGLLTVLYAATDIKTFIAGKYHYILYYLTLSIYPRMLITVSNLTLFMPSITGQREPRTSQHASARRPGRGHGRPGGQAEENHWLPNSRHPSAHPARRTRRVSDGRIHFRDGCARELCDSPT